MSNPLTHCSGSIETGKAGPIEELPAARRLFIVDVLKGEEPSITLIAISSRSISPFFPSSSGSIPENAPCWVEIFPQIRVCSYPPKYIVEEHAICVAYYELIVASAVCASITARHTSGGPSPLRLTHKQEVQQCQPLDFHNGK